MSDFGPHRTQGVMLLMHSAHSVLSGTIITVSVFIHGSLNSDIYLSLLRGDCPSLNLHPNRVGN